MWPSFELVECFIPVLFICKFHKDWITIKQAMLQTKRIVPSCRNSNLFPDFMPIQVICNFHKDPIKTKQAMLQTRSNMVLIIWASNLAVDSLIRLEFELVRDFMHNQIICKFHKVLIKTKEAICSGHA